MATDPNNLSVYNKVKTDYGYNIADIRKDPLVQFLDQEGKKASFAAGNKVAAGYNTTGLGRSSFMTDAKTRAEQQAYTPYQQQIATVANQNKTQQFEAAMKALGIDLSMSGQQSAETIAQNQLTSQANNLATELAAKQNLQTQQLGSAEKISQNQLDATANNQAAELDAKKFLQIQQLLSNENISQNQLDATANNQAAEISAKKDINTQSLTSTEKMAANELQSKANLLDTQIAANATTQDKQISSAEKLATTEISSKEKMFYDQLDTNKYQFGADMAYKEAVFGKEYALKEQQFVDQSQQWKSQLEAQVTQWDNMTAMQKEQFQQNMKYKYDELALEEKRLNEELKAKQKARDAGFLGNLVSGVTGFLTKSNPFTAMLDKIINPATTSDANGSGYYG